MKQNLMTQRINRIETQPSRIKVAFLSDLNEKEVIKVRKQFNLPPIRKGWRMCLGTCGKKFFSRNLKADHMCDPCKLIRE